MDEFNWLNTKRSVVKLAGGERSGWFFLSQGANAWKLRTFDPYEEFSYHPSLANLPGRVQVQLTMPQVVVETGLPATTTVHAAHEEWAQILAALATYGNNAPLVPPGGVPSMQPAPGGDDPPPPQQPIPVTKLRRLYETLGYLLTSLDSHTHIARELERQPARLAQYFNDSRSHFSRYANVNEPFIPEGANRRQLPEWNAALGITDTRTLTALVANDPANPEQTWPVEGDDSLAFKYVDRELVLTRTTGNARYEDPRLSGTKLDWLLRNEVDATPVIAEVKVGNDKSPFFALIQLLMYAAELMTEPQLQRLGQHHGDQAFFANRGGLAGSDPSVILYIVLANYNYRSRVRESLLEATDKLSQSLIADTEITAFIKRIACLEATRGPDGVHFKRLFSHELPD